MKKKMVLPILAAASLFFSPFAGHIASAESADKNLEGTNGREIVIHKPDDVSSSKINELVNRFKKGIEEDRASNQKISMNKNVSESVYDNAIYDYTIIGEDYVYKYEETPDKAPVLTIEKPDFKYLPEGQNDRITTSAYNIGDGIGGRQNITKNGRYLSTLLRLPLDSQVVEETAAYNYSGFTSGAYEADMGLVYDSSVGVGEKEKGWKPTMIVKRNGVSKAAKLIAGYTNVQGSNAYLPNSNVNLYVWYNDGGKVRMKINGIATCADMACNRSTDTPLISIMETNDSLDINSVDQWKLLSTVVSTGDRGRNKAIYSSIKVDGASVPSSAFSAPLTDYANIARDGNNTVTITVRGK
ncbi:YrpD family protein [Paenibacillus sp. NPDC055715]